MFDYFETTLIALTSILLIDLFNFFNGVGLILQIIIGLITIVYLLLKIKHLKK